MSGIIDHDGLDSTTSADAGAPPLLEVKNLKTHFTTPEGIAPAVDGISFSIKSGETLSIVGESGCGKSVASLSILRLIPNPPGKIVGGSVLFQGVDLLTLSSREIRKIRGKEIAMIFQEPMTSLNPVFSIGWQLTETILEHENISARAALKRAVDMLRLVGIGSPEQRINEFPHQLSGGMRQRVMIAMALACRPKVLIADEPTTALDVTIQAQILDLIARLKRELGMAVILITHDLGVVAETAQRVCVMYAGKFVETASVRELFANPHHPYMQGLLRALPAKGGNRRRLEEISGQVPLLTKLGGGCQFCPRYERRDQVCRQEEPPWTQVGTDHWVRCWAVASEVARSPAGAMS